MCGFVLTCSLPVLEGVLCLYDQVRKVHFWEEGCWWWVFGVSGGRDVYFP